MAEYHQITSKIQIKLFICYILMKNTTKVEKFKYCVTVNPLREGNPLDVIYLFVPFHLPNLPSKHSFNIYPMRPSYTTLPRIRCYVLYIIKCREHNDMSYMHRDKFYKSTFRYSPKLPKTETKDSFVFDSQTHWLKPVFHEGIDNFGLSWREEVLRVASCSLPENQSIISSTFRRF